MNKSELIAKIKADLKQVNSDSKKMIVEPLLLTGMNVVRMLLGVGWITF